MMRITFLMYEKCREFDITYVVLSYIELTLS